MSDEREGDLNLIQLQRVTDADENGVIKTFIHLHPRALFTVKSIINSNVKRIASISICSFVLRIPNTL